MNDIKKKLIKEFDKISYVDFKRLEEEPIDLEYLKKRKKQITKQFRLMQILYSVVGSIVIVLLFYLAGSDFMNHKTDKFLLIFCAIILPSIFIQLIWNKKYTNAQKNIFIIELLEEIEKEQNIDNK